MTTTHFTGRRRLFIPALIVTLLLLAVFLSAPAISWAQAVEPGGTPGPGVTPIPTSDVVRTGGLDSLNVLRVVFDNVWTRLILGMIASNILSGLAVALFTSKMQFYLGSIGDWLQTKVLPYLLGWGCAKIVVLVALGDMEMTAQVIEAVVSAAVIAALFGKTLDNLRVIWPQIPEWAGDKPRIETKSTP